MFVNDFNGWLDNNVHNKTRKKRSTIGRQQMAINTCLQIIVKDYEWQQSDCLLVWLTITDWSLTDHWLITGEEVVDKQVITDQLIQLINQLIDLLIVFSSPLRSFSFSIGLSVESSVV